MPVGPGAESVRIDLYAPDPSASRWDAAVWDGGAWAAAVWSEVGCDVIEAAYLYGATEEAGVLSLPVAGGLDLSTRDPKRHLDPSNADGPFFGYVAPGTPVRIQTAPSAGALGALVNGSFEQAPPLTGWTPTAPALAEQSLLVDSPDGAYTLRLFGDGVTQGPAVSQVVATSPLVRVAAFATARCAAGTEGRMRVDGLNAAGATVASGLLLVATTSASFIQIGGAFDVPAGVSKLRLHLYMLGVPAAGAAVRFDAVRLEATAGVPAWTGFLDEATYDVASARGKLRAVDGVAYLAQADLADGLALPNTLRARIRAVITAAGLDAVVQLVPDVADMDPDPPVAAYDGKGKTAWTAILDAAQDALYFIWLGPAGYLHATSWGGFPDAPFALGCGDPAEGPWIEGVRTIGYGSSAEAIRNGVRAWSAPSVVTAVVRDQPSANRYGLRTFAVDRVVPDFATWSARILADRAGAGLGVKLGEVRPYDTAELNLLLGLAVGGPQIVRVRDEDHPPVIDQTVGAIGANVRVTSAGWSFGLVSMIPRAEWDAVLPPAPKPPDPPPGQTWHTETRSYLDTSDALLALTPGGAKYGAGAADSLPVGAWSGWTYRACMKLATIPWTKVKRVVSATLRLNTSTQVRIGFGSSPTIEVRRITSQWSAGSSSSPSGSNAVVYPGPSTTSTGAKRSNVPTGQGASVSIDVTALARAWAPSSAGGSGASQYGVMLLPGSGSQADTTEFWPVEKGGANRPQLDLVLEVFD